MKLRLQGDSIRLRLSAAEVERLAAEGAVEERTRIGPGAGQHLIYAIELAPGIDALHAVLADGELRVLVPARAAREWASGDEIGLYRVADEDGAAIAVEKDLRGSVDNR